MTLPSQPSRDVPTAHREIRLGLRNGAPGDASIYRLQRDHDENPPVVIQIGRAHV